nr:sulfotransferase [Thioalkalivibrio sp. ALJT]
MKAKPSRVGGLVKKARRALDDGAFDELQSLCGEILGIEPDSTDALRLLIQAAFERQQYSTATLYASKLVQMHPEDAAGYNALAGILILRGRYDAAGAALREALRLDPDMLLALDNYAIVLQAEGKWEEASEILESLVATDRHKAKLWFSYAHSRYFSPESSTRHELERVLKKGKYDLRDQGRMHFALAKLRHDAGEVDAAFESYQAGNRCQAEVIGKEVEQVRAGAMRKTFRATEKLFDTQWVAGIQGPEVSPRPLTLVLGPPRSGKSLLEGALAAHSRIRDYGELAALREVLTQLPSAVRKRYPLVLREMDGAGIQQLRTWVDATWGEPRDPAIRTHLLTNPGNILHAGTIMTLNPDTRLVFCERDPVENAMAIFMRWFAHRLPYAWAVDTIAEFIVLYRGLTDHWEELFPDRVQRIRYEEMLEAPDRHVSDVLQAHGLDWEPDCANAHGEAITPETVGVSGSSSRRSQINPAFGGLGEVYAAYRPIFVRALDAAAERAQRPSIRIRQG